MREISKKNDPIRQHHVPQAYLRNFCNLSEAIAVLDKRSRKVFSTGIRVVGAENDFYTLEKMEDPYCWEHIYAAGMDSQIGEIIPRIISQANILVRNRSIIINDSEKVTLAAIMVMQMLRGKRTREYERELYQNYLPDALRKTREVFGLLNDKQNELLRAYENDDYYFKRASMDLALDSQRITQFTNVLCNLNFLFYRILGDAEFITSDNPVMIINLKTGNARPFANGLLKTNTAVCYPLSPKLLLCAMHPEFTFEVFSDRDCSLLDLDATRETKYISTINQKQIEQCFQHAFAQSESVLKQYRKQTPERAQ